MTDAARRRPGTADDGGMAIPLIALMLTVIMAMAAFAVDLGAVAKRTRDLQGIADLAALDASHKLNGSSLTTYQTADAALSSASPLAAARASAVRNGFNIGGNQTLTVEYGSITDSTSTGASYATVTTGTATPDAIRVYVGDRVGAHFAFDDLAFKNVSRNAIARKGPSLCFQVGSYAVGVQTDDNALLTGLGVTGLGSVSVASYSGLLGATLDLGDLAVALGAGSVDQLMNGSFTVGQYMSAAATALNNSGQSSAATAIGGLSTAAIANTNVALNTIIAQGTVGSGSVLTTGINAFQFVKALASVADGDSFSTFNSTAALGGFNVSTAYRIINRPTIRCKAIVGSQAHNGQVRTLVTFTRNLSLAGLPLIAVNLPVFFEAAQSTATIQSIVCSKVNAAPTSVSVGWSNETLQLYVGNVTAGDLSGSTVTPPNKGNAVTVVNVFLPGLGSVSITARNNTAPTGVTPTTTGTNPLVFTPNYTSPSNIPMYTNTNSRSTGSSNTAISSLLTNITYSVSVSALPLVDALLNTAAANILASLQAAVATLATSVDAGLVNTLGPLGVKVGGSDIIVDPRGRTTDTTPQATCGRTDLF